MDPYKVKIYKKSFIIVVFLIVYLLLMGGLLWWLISDSNKEEYIEKLGSPAIIVLAIVITVLTFTLSSAVFAAVGKSRSDQALGMPDGSIRALIALSLIALFFILATQIYLRSSQGVLSSLNHISDEQLKEISIKDMVSKAKSDSLVNKAHDSTNKEPKYIYFYDVQMKLPPSSDAADMAKTIVASFISLIAAISGFYFGTASNKANPPPTDPNALPPGKISPKPPFPITGTKGQEMTFEWTVSPLGQPLSAEITGDSAQPLADASNTSKFTYTPTVVGTITLKVHLKNFPAISETHTITIKEKA